MTQTGDKRSIEGIEFECIALWEVGTATQGDKPEIWDAGALGGQVHHFPRAKDYPFVATGIHSVSFEVAARRSISRERREYEAAKRIVRDYERALQEAGKLVDHALDGLKRAG